MLESSLYRVRIVLDTVERIMYHTLKAEYAKMHRNNREAYRLGRPMGEYLKIKKNIERMERELEFMIEERV